MGDLPLKSGDFSYEVMCLEILRVFETFNFCLPGRSKVRKM